MSNFKKLSAYADVPCEWVSVAVPRNGKLDQLQAENDKLREQSERLFDKTLELATENAKLRLLVRAAWRCIHTGANCSDCRLIAGGCTLQTAMRELGIEVDE